MAGLTSQANVLRFLLVTFVYILSWIFNSEAFGSLLNANELTDERLFSDIRETYTYQWHNVHTSKRTWETRRAARSRSYFKARRQIWPTIWIQLFPFQRQCARVNVLCMGISECLLRTCTCSNCWCRCRCRCRRYFCCCWCHCYSYCWRISALCACVCIDLSILSLHLVVAHRPSVFIQALSVNDVLCK